MNAFHGPHNPFAENREERLAYAAQTIAGPQKWPHQHRVEPAGELVVQLILPLALFHTANATRHWEAWRMARYRKEVLACIRPQVIKHTRPAWQCYLEGLWFREPLPGRPMVRAVRFTIRQTDAGANFKKTPIDCLLPRHKRGTHLVDGIGMLRNDGPDDVEQVEWCERAPRGLSGFGLVEIWTGEPIA